MNDRFKSNISIWKEICTNLDSTEVDELKGILKEGFIDELDELHKEVDILKTIWLSCKDAGTKGEIETELPDPPHVREQLHKQINLFLELLSTSTGKDKWEILHSLSSTSVCHEVKSYHDSKAENNCSSYNEQSIGDTKNCNKSSASAQLSEETVQNLIDKHINAEYNDNNLEKFASCVRAYLVIERDTLMENVTYLQNSILQTNNESSLFTSKRKPSIQELRKVGNLLEHEVLKNSPEPGELKSAKSRKQCLNPVVKNKQNERSCRSAPTKHTPSAPLAPMSPPRTGQIHLEYRRRVLGNRAVSLPAIPSRSLDRPTLKKEICTDDI